MSFISTLKGMVGEIAINIAMWLKLDKEIYYRINNVTLPLFDADNQPKGSTQIDHIIVSKYGIFVIETKNYKGWIFGNERQAQWTQSLYGKKFKFQNPIRQNYLHIKTLAELLELEERYFHSLIAFIGECEIKTKDKLPDYVMSSGMASYVLSKQDVLLTDAQVKDIVSKIESGRFEKSWQTNRKHREYLKERLKKKALKQESSQQTELNQKQQPISVSTDNSGNCENPVPNSIGNNHEAKHSKTEVNCPKCGSSMVKRVAKTGARAGQAFWGCSRFPKCRGVVNI